MAASMKVLAQAYPAAATGATLYTAGAGVSTVVSTLAVCNTTSGQLTFRVAVIPNGGSLSSSRYIAYESKVASNDTNFITVGITLESGASIYVYNGTVGIAYSLFGTELV